MKKLLRLYVMTKLSYDEVYIKTALKSLGIEISELTHAQICVFKASLKKTEANLLIEMAFDKDEPATVKDIDCSIFIK